MVAVFNMGTQLVEFFFVYFIFVCVYLICAFYFCVCVCRSSMF